MNPDRRSVLAGAAALPLAYADLAAAAAPDAPGAREVLAQERALAAAEAKGVLIEFYASWCVWCTPMDLLLSDAAVTPILHPRFRVLRMRVLERRGVELARQLRGADDVFHQYAPVNAGLPFLAFVDGDGRALVSSVSAHTNENIGFPVTADDLDWFEFMLATAAPESTTQQRAAARAACLRLYAGRR